MLKRRVENQSQDQLTHPKTILSASTQSCSFTSFSYSHYVLPSHFHCLQAYCHHFDFGKLDTAFFIVSKSGRRNNWAGNFQIDFCLQQFYFKLEKYFLEQLAFKLFQPFFQYPNFAGYTKNIFFIKYLQRLKCWLLIPRLLYASSRRHCFTLGNERCRQILKNVSNIFERLNTITVDI